MELKGVNRKRKGWRVLLAGQKLTALQDQATIGKGPLRYSGFALMGRRTLVDSKATRDWNKR